MGSASSKTARKLPRERPRGPTDLRSPAVRPERPLSPQAFENKNEAIERDAKDPHLMAKLNQLGPVRVDHPTHAVHTARSDVQNMYRSRMRSEAAASDLQSTENRLLASSLTELLDARKSVTSHAQLETLAKQYCMDVAKLEELAQVVNTPSIDQSTVVRTTDKHGEASLTMMARWVDPVLLNHAKE